MNAMITKPLFWEDSYLKECNAIVTRVDGNRIYLDQTVFFYGGGGQVPDTGTINGMQARGSKDDDGEICHVVEGNSFKVGDSVAAKIDWDKRYRIMRLHSASHLLYFLLKELDPKMTGTSGEVDERKERSDYLFSFEIDLQTELPKISQRLNEVIEKGYEIRVSEKHREGFETNPWTNAPESGKEAGVRRVWKVELFPEMECGGTHPKNTREIGRVQVSKGKSPGKGRKRIEVELIE
jgi:alanyl-tRNA synthetase